MRRVSFPVAIFFTVTLLNAADYKGIVLTGNSICQGTNSRTAISTTQPYSNVQPNGSNRGLVALGTTGLESPLFGIVNQISSMGTFLGIGQGLNYCISGGGYFNLGPGTAAYNNTIAQIAAVKSLATTGSDTYSVSAVTLLTAENADRDTYVTQLVNWQSSYETAIKAITGQTGTIPLFVDQWSNWGGYASGQPVLREDGVTPWSAMGGFKAQRENYGKIVLVGPRYRYPYVDASHFTAVGYLQHGEIIGKFIRRYIDGQNPKPLSPRSISIAANVITLRLWVPGGSVVIDTTTLSDATGQVGDWPHQTIKILRNKGFEWWDDSCTRSGGCPTTISNVALTPDTTDSLTIALSRTPTGSLASQRLRYAYTGVANTGAQGTPGAPHGNIRDTDPTISQNANVPDLYDWLISFDEPVGFRWEPDRPQRPRPSPPKI